MRICRILLIRKAKGKQNFSAQGTKSDRGRVRSLSQITPLRITTVTSASSSSPSRMAFRTVLLTHSKLWTAAAIACLAALAGAALLLPQTFLLTALSDLIQCVLLISCTIAFLPHALKSQGRMRLFWALIASGMAFWLSYQLLWTYFEVWLHQDVPDPFGGDIVLFLHFVPLMAALALRPHLPQDEYATRLGRLDFALLTVWWIYLYVLIVIPWCYVITNELAYSRNLNAVYLLEKVAFLGALAAACLRSKGRWRTFYGHLFGASLTYAASSYVANWAISRNVYYSGSLYDIPLVASMIWIVLIGLWTRDIEPDAKSKKTSTAYGVWVPRLAMIAVFSLPLFAAWALSDIAVPARIRSFRVVLTLAAAFAMGIMVFLRQHFLDRELIRLLNHSRDSVENLKHLQAQIVESEKLASIGQLVGGAAHELNNPITAMLGYSDLLTSASLSSAQHALAVRIGQHVRRTKSLVGSLLSLAKQTPTAKTPVNLNTLVRTAIKLSEPQSQPLGIEIRAELEAGLPAVMGDSNQLLQVCLQIVGDALHRISELSGGTLIVTTRCEGDTVIFQVSENAHYSQEDRTFNSAAEPSTAPALSACHGIVQEHHGRIVWESSKERQTTVRMELPCIPTPSRSASASPSPLLVESQPFA